MYNTFLTKIDVDESENFNLKTQTTQNWARVKRELKSHVGYKSKLVLTIIKSQHEGLESSNINIE